jgi:hypothetical protein
VSGSAEIATVTAALRNLLAEGMAPDPDLADTVFTTQPPDLARTDAVTANQLNLFLYRAAVNPAWSNLSVPGRVAPGEDAPPPLALTLSYLLTAYGRDNDARRPFSHLLLGRAMGVLHDNPILAAAPPAEAGLRRNIPPIRLTLQPLSLDDISKLWSGFQTHYRLSVAYEASVVLIESARPVRTPPPALRLGLRSDALPGGAMPLLDRPHAAQSPQSGDLVVLMGSGLLGDATIRLTQGGRSWDLPAQAAAQGDRVQFTLPAKDGPSAGWSTVTARLTRGTQTVTSNTLPLAIAPRIVSPLPMTVRQKADGVELEFEVTPPVRPEQTVSLLLGSRETPVTSRSAGGRTLHVTVRGLAAGSYLLRLRVDGVDSAFLDLSQSGAPAFDPAARLTVTA